MNIKKLLGEKIKRLRKVRGFTQEQFAEMIDITPRNLCRIEAGQSFVTSETLDKISDELRSCNQSTSNTKLKVEVPVTRYVGASKFCKKCGTANPSSATTCKDCGEYL